MKTFEEIFAEEYENTGCLNYKGFARKMYDRGAKNGFNQFLMDAEKDPSLYIDLARYLAVRLAKEAVNVMLQISAYHSILKWKARSISLG